jgi:small subunit ribosomal protein S16
LVVPGCHSKEEQYHMSVKIRLARYGTKKKPFYRIVVANNEAPRDGRFLELVGTYDPQGDPAPVTLKRERIQKWIRKGAIPTATVKNLLKKQGFFSETPNA